MIPPRAHIALAIDGGGIKGFMVARALMKLEKELGGKPLIEHPAMNILAGTSTGALITGGIALGMTAQEIADLYIQAGKYVFPPLFPTLATAPIPRQVPSALWMLIGLMKPSQHSNEPLKQLIREWIKVKTGNPDLTMGELAQRLRNDQALVLTTVDIDERRTHFIKSYKPNYANWKVWEAVLASAAAPTILPVFQHDGRYYGDGESGCFGNPAYVAAREAVEWQAYDTGEVTIFSFGAGWPSERAFRRARGIPPQWRIINWACNIPVIMIGDAIRAQSLDLIVEFIEDEKPGMDFRRFQIELEEEIAIDDASPATMKRLQELGDELGQRVLDDKHALGPDTGYDPEGLRNLLLRYERGVCDAPDRLRRRKSVKLHRSP